MPKKKSTNVFYGKIKTIEDASKVLKQVGYVFYATAGLNTLLALYVLFKHDSYIFFVDIATMLLLAYFLPNRRSRALAIGSLLYALLIVYTSIMSRMTGNIVEWGGGNTFLAIILVWTAIRSIQATFIYHRLQASLVYWRNVAIIWSTIAAVIILAMMGVAAYAVFLGENDHLALTEDQMGNYVTWIWLLLTSVIFVFGTRLLPYSEAE